MDKGQLNDEWGKAVQESISELNDDERELYRIMLVQSIRSSLENLDGMRKYIPVMFLEGRLGFSSVEFEEGVESFAEKHLDRSRDVEKAYVVLTLLGKMHMARMYMKEP